MGTSTLHASQMAEIYAAETTDEERLNFAIELVLSVKDSDLHHRVNAVAEIAKQHGLKLTRDSVRYKTKAAS